MIVKNTGAAIAFIVLCCLPILGSFEKMWNHQAVHQQKQIPENVDSKYSPRPPLTEGEHKESRKDDSNRQESSPDKLTDWLLVTFNLLLAAFTFLLWRSTEKLWRGSEEQLLITRNSVEISRKAAEAAQRSAEAVPNVERAYLIPIVTRPELKYGTAGAVDSFDIFGLWLENCGKTPAIVMSIFMCGARLDRYPDSVDDTIGNAILLKRPVHIVIAGGSKKYIDEVSVSRSHSEDMPFLYCWGYIRYSDIFGNPQTSTFCLGSDWKGGWVAHGPEGHNSIQ